MNKMKKLVFFLFLGIGSVLVLTNLFSDSTNASGFEVIPDDAIRLRILAHNDDEEEQRLKHLIRNAVSETIEDWVGHMSDIDEARSEIASRIDEVEQIVTDILAEEQSEHQATVAYDTNVQFPHKVYDEFIYPAGEYEAVLITIGDGNGANWWCVLFPPLCFLNFDSGSVVDMPDKTEEETVTVKFFFLEWFRSS